MRYMGMALSAAGVLMLATLASALTNANMTYSIASTANVRGSKLAFLRPDSTDGPVATGYMFATHNWNPTLPGRPTPAIGTYFSHPTGTSSSDGWNIFAEDNATMVAGVTFNTLFITSGGAKNTFYWRATKTNISNNFTTIDHALSNGNTTARLFVMPNASTRDGLPGVVNNHNIGVFYNGTKWAIFNQDRAAMPLNAGFSVFIESPSYGAVVVANKSNVNANSVYLDGIPALSGGNTAVKLIVTPNWSPPGGPSVYNDHPIGVWYDVGRQKWAIYNEDRAPMPLGAAFNVNWDTNSSTPG